MMLFAMCELRCLTRVELRALLERVTRVIDSEPTGTLDHEVALINYRNIRWLLSVYGAVPNPAPH